jgi:CRISPR-associated protein Cas5h
MATVFEISGRMAMFRKPYTTTSSVSFAFPPPTAIAGLVSAVIGIPNGSADDACNAAFWERMQGTKVAVSILNDLKWGRYTINFWNVKNPQKNIHIQVKHQFIRNPRYRVYVEGGLEDSLRSNLEKGAFIYTPYLGVAYALADIDYVGNFRSEPVQGENLACDTVIPWSENIKLGSILETGGVFKEQVPFRMDTKRTLMRSIAVLYPPTPEAKLVLKERGDADVTRCGKDVVAWFPEW